MTLLDQQHFRTQSRTVIQWLHHWTKQRWVNIRYMSTSVTLCEKLCLFRDKLVLMSYSLCVFCLSVYPSLPVSVTLHLFSVQTIVCFKGQRHKSIILAGETQTYHGLSQVSDVSSCQQRYGENKHKEAEHTLFRNVIYGTIVWIVHAGTHQKKKAH